MRSFWFLIVLHISGYPSVGSLSSIFDKASKPVQSQRYQTPTCITLQTDGKRFAYRSTPFAIATNINICGWLLSVREKVPRERDCRK
jgi:hypothetical protein